MHFIYLTFLLLAYGSSDDDDNSTGTRVRYTSPSPSGIFQIVIVKNCSFYEFYKLVINFMF
jgi:hypothetical protein